MASLSGLIEPFARAIERWFGRRGELNAARRQVIRRLKGLRTAEGKVWDDEKWHLGEDLNRFAEAISQARAGAEWSAAEEVTRERVLLAGERGAIDECLAALERLG